MTVWKLYGIKHTAKSFSHWGQFRVYAGYADRTEQEASDLFPDWEF